MTIDDYLKKGYECMSRDDMRSAVEYFQAASQSDPKNEEAKLCLYIAYNRQDKPQYAEKYHDGKIQPVNVPYSDTSYIKWHKEQVIAKWKRIFSAEFLNYLECVPTDDFIDDNDVISYQLILSRLKNRSQGKSAYYYLAHPLYCKDRSVQLPLLNGSLEIEKKHNLRRFSGKDEITVQSIKCAGDGYTTTDKFSSNVNQYFQGDNLLEKVEYEYYALWAHYYLGLWQWEQWHPFANMREIVGRRHEIIGIDEEMHEIAAKLNENAQKEKEATIFSTITETTISQHELLTPAFLEKPSLKTIEIYTNDDLADCGLEPLQNKDGNYGRYFASTLFFAGSDGKKYASAIFGSREDQKLEVGNRLQIFWSEKAKDNYDRMLIHDGVCIILE